MNTRTKKLDEILGSQKTDSSKTGIGYVHRAPTPKDKGKYVFVQGATMYSMTAITHNSPPRRCVNANYKTMPKPKFAPNCHFCWIKGNIRPHCNKMRNHLKKQ